MCIDCCLYIATLILYTQNGVTTHARVPIELTNEYHDRLSTCLVEDHRAEACNLELGESARHVDPGPRKIVLQRVFWEVGQSVFDDLNGSHQSSSR